MKTKFILHGGYTKHDNELNRSFFDEFTSSVPDGGTILIVLFAIEDERVAGYFNEFKEKFTVHTIDKTFNFTFATKENFLNQVKAADAIYIQGGSTQKLKQTLLEYPEFAESIKGKVVAGSSAGAYVLSTYYYTNSQAAVLKGLGILPIRIVCHYQSEIHPAPENISPVVDLNKFDNSLELICLKDFEWEIRTL